MDNEIPVEQTNDFEVLVVNSGLPEEKRPEIIKSLEKFFKEASKWDKTIATLVINSPEQIADMKVAGSTRLALKAMRGEAKEFIADKRANVQARMLNDKLEDTLWLKSWQMIEATFKNLESKCQEKELFAERWEAQEKEKRRTERIEKLAPFVEDVSIYNVGDLSEPAFNDLLEGSKMLHEKKQQKIADDLKKQEEEKRLADEKIRTDKLANGRRLELLKFGYDYEADDLGKLEETEYQKVVTSAIKVQEDKAKEIEDAKIKSALITTRLNQLLSLGMKYHEGEKTYHGFNLRVTENHLSVMEEADWNNIIAAIEKGAKAEKDKADKAEQAKKDNYDLNKLRLSQVTPYLNFGPELGGIDVLWSFTKAAWDKILNEKVQAFNEDQSAKKLQQERLIEISPYAGQGLSLDMTNLWVYTPEKWNEIFNAKKAAYDKKISDDAKAQEKIVSIPVSKPIESSLPADATDEQKLRAMLEDFTLPEVSLSSPEGRGVYNEMVTKLNGYKKWCINQISENL